MALLGTSMLSTEAALADKKASIKREKENKRNIFDDISLIF
jgi:hypothetical protein